jgi:Uma2 family endonuclease
MDTTTETGEKLYLPHRRYWTRQEYERAAEVGLFGPDERLELIEGEVIRKMTHNTPHATGIRLAEKLLNRIFGEGYDVRAQLPLALGKRSEPEPDIAVVVGSARDYEDEHPSSAMLVVEISDATLRLDRTTKASLYARAGIPEYWIVNLKDRLLEVHRQPGSMRGRPLGYGYQSVTTHTERESLCPLAAPQHSVAVADLLPRQKG